MAESLHQRIDRDRKAALPPETTWDDVSLHRSYYRGRQTGTLTAAQRKLLASVVGNRFCDNVCRKVVDEFAGRVVLTGWSVPHATTQIYLEELWTKNALPDLAADTHLAAIRDGNHAISLRWASPNPDNPREGRVTLHRERWWNGKEGVFIAYERDGTPAYAVRDWTEYDAALGRDVDRRIVWFADHIERFAKEGSGWKPFTLPGEAEGGVAPWVRPDGRPLGIPVIHFPKNSDDDGPYGASELDGGVIGMQDQVNDAQSSITATARLTGFQMLVMTGVKIEKNADGSDKSLKVGPGQTFQTENADAKMYPIVAGDLSQLKTAYMVKLEAVCRMTDTPLHLITGQWPSGEALFRAEMPLVTKADRLTKLVGPAWSTVAHRSTELANAFGGLGLDEEAMIEAQFAPADKRDPISTAQVLIQQANRAAAVEALRTEWGLGAAGVPADEVKALLAELSGLDEQAAERQRAMFDEGLVPPALGPGGA